MKLYFGLVLSHRSCHEQTIQHRCIRHCHSWFMIYKLCTPEYKQNNNKWQNTKTCQWAGKLRRLCQKYRDMLLKIYGTHIIKTGSISNGNVALSRVQVSVLKRGSLAFKTVTYIHLRHLRMNISLKMSQASSTQVRYTVKKNWEIYGNKTNKQYRELCLPELYCKKIWCQRFMF